MIEFFNDIMVYQFLQRALIAGIIVGLTCSILSSFVVLKKMAFIGHGISHGAFAGVAFGLLFGIDINITAGIFSVAVSTLIWFFSRKKKISEDSSIGILLVASMALGILLIGFRKEYTYDIFGYLFGNILSVADSDVWIISITGLLVVTTIILFYKELFYFLFDPESAMISGLNVDAYHLLLLTLLAVTIVISIKVVGIILVSAYLIISGATASLVTFNLKKMILISSGIGISSSIIGLWVSNSYELPSGAVIVLVMLFVFLATLLFGYIKTKFANR